MLDDDSTDPLGDEQVREDSILCAPLVTGDALVGLLKIAARHAGQFRPYDADLVEHFRSQAAIAIQNLHRTESLRSRVVVAERKHAMADLARSVSHDVNNALGAMLPLVQQLQEDLRGGRLEPAVLSEDLEQLQKSLQVCRRIFGGMLSFSRGAARRTGHAQVRRAIDTALAILKYGLGRSGIELAIDVPEDLPSVACSQSDLEQVFLNLLTNAREAMPHGGRITIEARSGAHGVEIAVSDSGCGIPKEHLPRVTEPFFTTKAHGNGLGLSICRSILWEVDGTIAIRSEAGAGTRVDIALPEAAGQPQPQDVMRASRILVVDDDPGMLRAVERVLGASHHIIGTTSPRDALLKAPALNPDLAIIDIRMPEMDGFELMARLKSQCAELDIILMTGSVDDLDEKLVRALRSPAFYFIQKPFDRDVLWTLVQRCLELRWRREEHQKNVERLETEMAEARAFQQSLLPDRETVMNGLAICCRYWPCARLGGDLYDYAAAESGKTALLVADVSGHGVSAAMLTGVVKSAFHASRADGFDPSAVVHRVWRALTPFSAQRFVTLFTALVVPAERQLRYASAGHPSIPLWSGLRDPVWLESTGPLISPVLPASWDVGTTSVDEGDQLLLYTDGVSETLAGGDCAKSRIQASIQEHAAGGAQLLDAIVDAVRRALAGRAQPDDLTLLTARVLSS